MNSARGTARTVGVLFIVATAAGASSAALLGSILDAPDLFASVSANESRVLAAVLLDLVLAGAVVGIAVLMAPILRHHTERVALGYLAARVTESVIILAGALGLLTLVTVSQQSPAAGAAGFSGVDTLLVAARDWTDLIGTQLVFGVTALILNYSFYRSRLIPRFVSVWGLVGAGLITASSLASVAFGLDPFSTIAVVMFLPLAVNEMVLAFWLIAKGFDLIPAVPETSPAHRARRVSR